MRLQSGVRGLLCLTLVASAGHLSIWARSAPRQQTTLDSVLAAYLGGDREAVARTFARPRDFQETLRVDNPRELERWLGSWHRGKALLLIEAARVSARVAPRYTSAIVSAGRGYLATAPVDDLASTEARTFAQLWHRAAVGLLQITSDPGRVEEHVDAVARKAGGPPPAKLDSRLALARAVAQERRCWDARPALAQAGAGIEALAKAAGVTIADDPTGPTKAARDAKVRDHAMCLRDALARFESAAGMDDTRAEARVRGGWLLFQQEHFAEALASLDAADPRDDRDLAYWQALFRGRALDALERRDDAAAAYQRALAIFPGAQSASIGLALEQVRLDRVTEADQVARAVRSAGAAAADPWSIYLDADRRFVDRWIDQMRTVAR